MDPQHEPEAEEGNTRGTGGVKRVRLIISSEADSVYHYLENRSVISKIERSIFNSVCRKMELVRLDYKYGSPIPKILIPNIYRQKYEITNLFHVELSNFWRMLYSVTNDEAEREIVVLPLDIFDHDTYNKKFGYRGQ